MGVQVMDRCNLTILEQPGQEDLAGFLAAQAGRDRRLDALLSARTTSTRSAARACSTARSAACSGSTRSATAATARGSTLNLVYNPQGPSLPPPQAALEADYKRVLGERFGIVFNNLFTLANMPIQRFGSIADLQGRSSTAISTLLQHAHRDDNLDGVMCRNLISVDYRGYVYDCDFNQMLDLPLTHGATRARAPVRPARRRHRRTIRSASPAIASAAPPARARAAAAR